MHIGLCVGHSQQLPSRLAHAASIGIDNVQLVSWQTKDWHQQEAQRILAMCRAYGITLSAMSCGWEGPASWDFQQGPQQLGLVPLAYRARRVQNLKDGADFANMLGLRDVISHMGFIPENAADPQLPGLVEAIREVALHVKQNDQRLLFETGQETPVALLRCIQLVGMDNVFVNLDPANLILYGKANPVDAMDIIGSLVQGVHAKDGFYPTDPMKLGREAKVGQGKVDFPRLIAALKAAGYDGVLSIEREIEGDQQLQDVADAKAYLEKLI